MPILRRLRKIGGLSLAQKEGFEPSTIYASTRLSTCFLIIRVIFCVIYLRKFIIHRLCKRLFFLSIKVLINVLDHIRGRLPQTFHSVFIRHTIRQHKACIAVSLTVHREMRQAVLIAEL